MSLKELPPRRYRSNPIQFLRRLVSSLLIGFSTLVVVTHLFASDQGQKTGLVYWVPVNNTIEQGLTAYLERALTEAEEAKADAVVVEMDTLGGDVGAALDIGKLFNRSQVPVTVFIRGEAISAGAYIALNAPTVVMTPNSAIGAAEPRLITGEQADPKTIAVWASNMRAAAEANGRNPEIAAGMVDRNTVIKGLKKKGELISLTAKEAVEYGIADDIVENRQDVLDVIRYPRAEVVDVPLTLAEKLARLVTSPFVVSLLFIIGLGGLAIEIFSPGFGLPGFIGLAAFALYFFGHYIAGFAGVESLVLFVVGLVLLIVEFFTPGFGLFGTVGLLAIATSIGLAAYDAVFSLTALVIAMVITVIVVVIVARYTGVKGTWRKLVLADKQENATGYVATTVNRDLIGCHGQTVTPLRPSGAAIINGKRYDVISEGGFVEAGQPVTVVQVTGGRIVVREGRT